MGILSVDYWQEFALKYGVFGLAINSFVEAIFFPVPPDILLIALCISKPESAFLYAAVATLFSSAGGVGGYYLGYFGGKPLAVRFFGKERVDRVHRLYQSYESIIILLAGFTPLPYKLFTVSAGVLFVSIYRLFLFSLIGRGTRFFTEAALFYLYGPHILGFLRSNLNAIFSVTGLALLLLFLVRRRLKRGVLP